VTEATPGLVDIVREFLAADAALRRLLERYRQGDLAFEEVEILVDDDERSPLFRLKERCHALFRPGPGRERPVRPREVLFDLAVGSLFHEAMKFRENFYQWEVYGPRVRALRQEAGAEAEPLFREFERILAGVSDRLEEGLHETEALLDRTREQLFVLLSEHSGDGPLARFLIENQDRVETGFGERVEPLFERIYGDRVKAYALAGESYLASGYYAEAERALTGAVARGGARAALEKSLAYARGMAAYLRGNYAESVAELSRWAGGEGARDASLVERAHHAVSKIPELLRGRDREKVVAEVTRLAARLASLRGPQAARAASRQASA
jgi:hypothetical protein